jgi:hypothetical protein
VTAAASSPRPPSPVPVLAAAVLLVLRGRALLSLQSSSFGHGPWIEIHPPSPSLDRLDLSTRPEARPEDFRPEDYPDAKPPLLGVHAAASWASASLRPLPSAGSACQTDRSAAPSCSRRVPAARPRCLPPSFFTRNHSSAAQNWSGPTGIGRRRSYFTGICS